MPAEDWIHEPYTLHLWRQSPFALAVIGGVFILVLGAVALWLVPTVDLTCQRQGAQVPGCQIEWRVFFDRVSIRHTSVRELRAVEVSKLTGEPSTRGATNMPNYQLTLSTEEGELVLHWLGEWAPVEAARQQVAAFLDNLDEHELRVTIGPTGPFVWIRRVGAGLVLLGLFAWASVVVQIGARLFRGN